VAGIAALTFADASVGTTLAEDDPDAWPLANVACALAIAGFAILALRVITLSRAHARALADRERFVVDARHLARLQRFTAHLSRAATPAEIVEAVVTEGLATLGGRYSGVVRRIDGEIRIDWDTGYPDGVHQRMADAARSGPVPSIDVYRTRQPLFFDSGAALPAAYPHLADVWSLLAPTRAAAVPMMAGEALMGVIVVYYQDRAGFSSEEREFILSVARMAAQGLQRAGLFAATRANELRLVTAQQAAAIATWDWDIAADRAEVSAGYRTMLGLPPGSGLPTYETWLGCVHPDDRARVAAELAAALATDTGYESVFRVRHPDGTVRHLLSRGLIHRGDDGRPVRMLGAVTDVTETGVRPAA